MFNKAGGGPLANLIKTATSDSVSRDHTTPQASTSRAESSFRQSTPASDPTTLGDEFGSFASPSSSHAFRERPYASSWDSRQPPRDLAGPEALSSRYGQQDGFEIQELLAGSTLVEKTDADWERELFESQRRSHDVDSSLPRDPRLASSTSFARSQAQHIPGDLSPTSSELLSSLSSLDLSSLAYLQTLLSLPPEQAVQRYFEATDSSYTDDVWGIPQGVRDEFDRFKNAGEAVKNLDENGKKKAVRRLGMLMQHLELVEKGHTVAQGDVKGKGKALDGSRTITTGDVAEKARRDWAADWEEYPLAASHVRSPPRQYFENSLPPTSPPAPVEDFTARILPYPLPSATTTTQAHSATDNTSRPTQAIFSVPSSLSSEAFVVHGYDDGGDVDRRRG
ncbi:hypothetical protein JCM3766R1_003554 [Sporobolomyces carnicolor]